MPVASGLAKFVTYFLSSGVNGQYLTRGKMLRIFWRLIFNRGNSPPPPPIRFIFPSSERLTNIESRASVWIDRREEMIRFERRRKEASGYGGRKRRKIWNEIRRRRRGKRRGERKGWKRCSIERLLNSRTNWLLALTLTFICYTVANGGQYQRLKLAHGQISFVTLYRI